MRDTESLLIHVLIQDETSIPPETLAAARAIAERIFDKAGVRIEWLDSESALSVKALGEADRTAYWKALYTVHVVTRVTAATPGNALGFASPGTRVSTVVYQRVEQMSRDAGTDPAVCTRTCDGPRARTSAPPPRLAFGRGPHAGEARRSTLRARTSVVHGRGGAIDPHRAREQSVIPEACLSPSSRASWQRGSQRQRAHRLLHRNRRHVSRMRLAAA